MKTYMFQLRKTEVMSRILLSLRTSLTSAICRLLLKVENLPELWLVKLGLEERYPVKLGDWRTEEEAEKELLQKFQGGGKA